MSLKNKIRFGFLLLVFLACSGQPVQLVTPPSGRPLESFQASGKNAMVATADNAATQAGVEILKKGGNAVDAFTTVSFVLAVTQPHHTGIGAGGFALVKLAPGEAVHAIDFREKAPSKAFRNMYLQNGQAVSDLSQNGPLAAGIPGMVAGVLEIQKKFGSGKFSLEQLIAPAIHLAKEGFPINPLVAEYIQERKEILARYPATTNLFLPHGKPLKSGDLLVQADLAKTLEKIAHNGSKPFYQGEIAQAIVSQVQKDGGLFTLNDFSAYEPKERAPVRGIYRGYQIFSMPPPSSGGVHVIQILNILEQASLKKNQTTETIHWVTEASRHAYADRATYLGDPDFYPVPVTKLVSKEYAHELFKKITPRATGSETLNPQSTTHFSIVDAEGNLITSTQTLNLAFGSGYIVPGTGIILNDQMDDFSAQPGVANAFGLVGGEANAIQPGKRPLSSASPTIVLNPEGEWYLVAGAAGGSRIITAVVQIILNRIDFNLSPLQAVAAGRTHHQWLPDKIFYEENSLLPKTKDQLLEEGYQLEPKEKLGVAHIVSRWKGEIVGVADPRQYGTAAGY